MTDEAKDSSQSQKERVPVNFSIQIQPENADLLKNRI